MEVCNFFCNLFYKVYVLFSILNLFYILVSIILTSNSIFFSDLFNLLFVEKDTKIFLSSLNDLSNWFVKQVVC